MRTSLALLLSALVVACGSNAADDPPPFTETIETEQDELAAVDVDPNEEPIVDEDDLPTDADDDVILDQITDVDDSPIDESDETDEPELNTMSLHPAVATPNEAIGHMKPRHCSIGGKTISDCMCFDSPLNCQMPSTQRGRNRVVPHDLYLEVVKRTDKARADAKDPSKISTPTDFAAWKVAPGTTVYDGNGVPRGTIKDKYASGKLANECFGYDGVSGYEPKGQGGTCTRINFGLKKKMGVEGNVTMVYAFAVTTESKAISGWISSKAIDEKQRQELFAMRTVAGKTIASSTFANTDYVVMVAEDFGSKLPNWFEGKVIKPKTTCADLIKSTKNGKVGDYLVRSDNTWNLAYNTPGPGGISVDTFVLAKDALGFKRVKSTKARPTLVRSKVYCSSSLHSMVFAYGAIKTAAGSRFGWVPLRGIKKGQVAAAARAAQTPPPAQQSTTPTASNEPIPAGFCSGKTDGFYCLDVGDGTVAAHCVGSTGTDTLSCPGSTQCATDAGHTAVTCQ